MITLGVELGDRSYPIYIGEDLLGDENILLQHIPGKNVLVVSNETVAPLYLDKTLAMLTGKHIETCILPDGEEYKTLEILNRIFDALLEKRFNRNCCLVALGGGDDFDGGHEWEVGDRTVAGDKKDGIAAAGYLPSDRDVLRKCDDALSSHFPGSRPTSRLLLFRILAGNPRYALQCRLPVTEVWS